MRNRAVHAAIFSVDGQNHYFCAGPLGPTYLVTSDAYGKLRESWKLHGTSGSGRKKGLVAGLIGGVLVVAFLRGWLGSPGLEDIFAVATIFLAIYFSLMVLLPVFAVGPLSFVLHLRRASRTHDPSRLKRFLGAWSAGKTGEDAENDEIPLFFYWAIFIGVTTWLPMFDFADEATRVWVFLANLPLALLCGCVLLMRKGIILRHFRMSSPDEVRALWNIDSHGLKPR